MAVTAAGTARNPAVLYSRKKGYSGEGGGPRALSASSADLLECLRCCCRLEGTHMQWGRVGESRPVYAESLLKFRCRSRPSPDARMLKLATSIAVRMAPQAASRVKEGSRKVYPDAKRESVTTVRQ